MNSHRPGPPDHPDHVYVPYAQRSLALMAAGDERGAMAELHRMNTELGGGNIYVVLAMWMDLAIDARSAAPGGSVELSYVDARGKALDVDRLPPQVVWAGRLLAARLAGDEDTQEALVEILSPQQRPAYVLAVLQLAARLFRGDGTITDLGPALGGGAGGASGGGATGS